MLQAQRLQHQPFEGGLEGFTGEHFDHPAQQGETRVGVGVGGPGRRKLLEVDQFGDITGQCVITAAGIRKIVAFPATGVGEQVTWCHRRRDVRIGQLQVG